MWKVARDGRRRKLRWQVVPHLRASNRKCSASNSGAVNRRLNEAVAAGRAKPSATWKVGSVSERAKVRRCTAVEDLVHQDGNFGPDAWLDYYEDGTSTDDTACDIYNYTEKELVNSTVCWALAYLGGLNTAHCELYTGWPKKVSHYQIFKKSY